MNGVKFVKLSASEKKKVVKTAIEGANKDQRALVEKYRKMSKSKK